MAKWTPSPAFTPGNTKSGTAVADTHEFTGSVDISGSLSVNGVPIGGGGGDVTGPGSSTENALALYDDATGKVLKNSGVLVDGLGALSASVLTSSTLVSSGDIYLRPSERVWITGSAASSDAVQLFIQNKHSNYSNISIQNQTNIGPSATHGLIMGTNSHKGQIRMMSDGGNNTTLTLGVESAEHIFMDTNGNVALTENITLGNASTDYHQVSGTLDVSGSVISTFSSTRVSASAGNLALMTGIVGSHTFDCGQHNIFKIYYGHGDLQITGSNLVEGAAYAFHFENVMGGMPAVVTYDPGTFKFPGGTVPTITDVFEATDILTGICVSGSAGSSNFAGLRILADMTKDFK